MAVAVTSRVRIDFLATITDTKGLANVSGPIEESTLLSMASGVGADQADRVFSERDLAISGNTDKDLSGVLTDIFGTAITFARIKALYIKAAAANTGTVIVGGIGATGFVGPFGANTHTVAVRPGGAILFFAPDATGYTVTAASADILRFAPSTGTQTFSWAVLGASA